LHQDYITSKINFCIFSGKSLTKTPPDETWSVAHRFCTYGETSLNSWLGNVHTKQAAL